MPHKQIGLLSLIIGSIGVVYGDIGTSPLYTLQVCFSHGSIEVTPDNIFGIISLIFWSLTLVVTIKYIHLVMRADNNGEGGIMALMALIRRGSSKKFYNIAAGLGILASSLFYGDGIITPAISVLGALEGLRLISPHFDQFVVPFAIFLLSGLFFLQRFGTHLIGNLFGPVMILWFLAIGSLGFAQIIYTPEILQALNPFYMFKFFLNNRLIGFLLLGAVVMAITGAEALYADMGHFGKQSIREAWFLLVYPALVLNYLGQGGLLLSNPQAISNPFYLLVPSWGLYSMLLLATLATIIASQAIISGIFSMTWQAIQLNYLPKMKVVHTSAISIGQIYIPFVNGALFVLTVLCILIFQSTEKLGYAYGITITGIFVITTILISIIAHTQWKWSLTKSLAIFLPILFIDISFFSANITKVYEGGWFPAAITLMIYLISTTWRKGIAAVSEINKEYRTSISQVQDYIKDMDTRIPGVAVYLSKTATIVPKSFRINLQHYKYIHEKIVFVSIITSDIPKIHPSHRLKINTIGNNIYQAIASYGFIEVPNMTHIIEKATALGFDINLNEATFFISRDIPLTSMSPYLTGWREKLFIFLAKNSADPTTFFKFPKDKTIELISYEINI